MPRTKRANRDSQVYKLATYGAIVTIDYDVNNPPPFFQPSSGIVIVGEHYCNPIELSGAAHSQQSVAMTNGPTEDTPDMIAWKQRRNKPLTPADTAREAGFPALDFETAQNIAASMGGGDEIVE